MDVTDHGMLTGLTDDDHPQYLLGDGVRASTNGFAVTGTLGSGTIPATGPGVRLLWYPGKAAFRAGEVPGTEWDDANVGPYSTAMGRQAKASGYGSTALGNGVTATGNSSTALGGNLTAGADVSTAIGQASTATGVGSITIGSFLHEDGDFSLAMGKQASTNGQT